MSLTFLHFCVRKQKCRQGNSDLFVCIDLKYLKAAEFRRRIPPPNSAAAATAAAAAAVTAAAAAAAAAAAVRSVIEAYKSPIGIIQR